ncbi:hypothetical protein HZA99_00865 [Candidatus Woesearchaeota archaeon]|nr:hypothetical protein [Candidatus Woesearchaeota archaeon]
MTKLFSFIMIFVLFSAVAVHADYNINLKTTPEQITARDDPFVEYPDLGALPEITISVTDAAGAAVKDTTMTAAITHNGNLWLGSGFPFVEGTQLLSVTSYESEGILTIPALLFPLRGDYTLDVKVVDSAGAEQTKQFTIHAKEPFWQTEIKGIMLLVGLVIFGAVVGLIFGKDLLKKKAQAAFSLFIFGIVLVSLFLVPFVHAHEGAADMPVGAVDYDDSQVSFYTNPEVPDIGIPTTFYIDVKDENGIPVNNAAAHITIENDEDHFEVLDLILYSKNGSFVFNYGIFDGAPHIVTVRIDPTEASSTQFAEIARSYEVAATAHNPPFLAKAKATFIMLLALMVGLVIGVAIRKARANKQAAKEAGDLQ